VGEEHVDASRPLRVIVDVDPSLTGTPGAQHMAWLLVTLLTRSTKSVLASVGIGIDDVPLHPGVDPAAPSGGPSFGVALYATADAFGPEAAPVIDASDLREVDLVLQIGAATRPWPEAPVLHVTASGWTGAVSPDPVDLPQLKLSENPFGPYVAACLTAGQVYMLARVHDHRVEPVALNAWTLGQGTDRLAEVANDDPGEPAVALDHVLAGAGAVGTALLLTLWAYLNASGTVRTADADEKGVDVTNLNRCLPFWWSDLGRPKAEVAAKRLNGRHGLVIEPTIGRAEILVDAQTHLISAVDSPDARQALQDKYPASCVQASTSGLRLEVLRVDPAAGTACLRCFNPPSSTISDTAIRARVSGMDDATIAAHAAAIGIDPDQVREWGQTGGCGQIGDALLDRLRPSDGGAAQFSVGFISVLAGILLAAQVVKDTTRRSGYVGDSADNIPLIGFEARFVTNLLDPVNALAGVRRYGRDPNCPACRGVRAQIWARRWTG
jgi:ThiF family